MTLKKLPKFEMFELHIIPDGTVVIKEGIIEAVGTTQEIEVKLGKLGTNTAELKGGMTYC